MMGFQRKSFSSSSTSSDDYVNYTTTKFSSDVSQIGKLSTFTSHISEQFRKFPNLEVVSFPKDIHAQNSKCWSIFIRGRWRDEEIKFKKYLKSNPLPYLPNLRKLSFGCFPVNLLQEILKIYAPQLESLEIMAGYLPDWYEMPRLRSLKLTGMSPSVMETFKNKMRVSPLANLVLVGTSGEVDRDHDFGEVMPLLKVLRSTRLFQTTLTFLELQFSGNVMWDEGNKFPRMELPVLKTLKLQHCSNVTFERYASFVFSLRFITSLSIDKALCIHTSRKCNLNTKPANCQIVGCGFRDEVGESGLWQKLGKLESFEFRGCGMKKAEILRRSTYNKLHSGNFMDYFSDPLKPDDDWDYDGQVDLCCCCIM